MQRKTSVIRLISIVLSGCLSVAVLAAEDMREPAAAQVIYAKGSQKSFKGPEAYFTGDVQVDMVFPGNETAHYSAAYVIFQPGARTAWHSHPAGQHMIIIAGIGHTGTRDGKIIEFQEGETVWCPPGIDHWHGAGGNKPMTHLVITGSKDGENVIWKEKVSDQEAGACNECIDASS